MFRGNRICALALALAALPGAALAEDGVVVHLGKDSPALHMPVGKQDVFAVPAFEDYMYMFFDLCDAMELKVSDECKIFPMNASIGKNAIATVQDGNRLIVYDRELSPLVGGDGAMMVIAHELGHHYCRHLGRPGDPKRELEADRFAGAAMRKANMTLEATLSAVPILDERPSKSHPGRADRVKAITAGWNNPETGKSCRS